MQILIIADRPPKEKITEILKKNHIDVICTLGDLDQSSLAELEHVTHIPKLGVYGNHDSGNYFEPLGITNMHLQTVTLNGIIFGGFEGCVRYKSDPYAKMYTQDEAKVLLENFPRVDVMLTHCPPRGINDEDEIAHQGFEALREYVEKQKPVYLFHGHTYPTDESLVTKLAQTNIVYVFGDKIVKI